MEKTMKVAVMQAIGKIGFERRPVPVPAAGEVLVQLEYVGICGSDLHYYETGEIAGKAVEFPFVLGHEPGGVVAQVGEGVTGLEVGDRVALEPGKTCGVCEFCRTGRYNLCPDVIFFATPPVDGVFQEYVAHPAELCFKLPDSVSTLEGALIEPLAIGFYAAVRGEARIGQRAVVTGAGCIGLVSMLALGAMGLSDIIMTDVLDNRLEKAGEMGAAHVINAAKADPVEAVRRLTGGKGCDLVIETSGSEQSARAAVEMVKKGGTIVLVGYSRSGNMNLPTALALDKEVDFKTIFRYRHIYPMAIEAVASGRVNVRPMITNIFSLDDIQNAMDQSLKNKQNIVKSVVKIRRDD
jgi:L-iditol 2-dehydrogenase